MSKPAKKMDRTKGLGGSDMAAILGVETFHEDGTPRNALHVYLETIGEALPRKSTLAMRLGNQFEDGIAQEWAKERGVKVRRRNVEVVAPGHPWMRGHVDRMIVGTRAGLEVKASSKDGWGEDGSADIPESIVPQVHHYLTALPTAPRWHVAALLWSRFGPPELRSYVIERDDEMSGILIEAGEKFMTDHVNKRVPPDPASSAQANKLWRRVVTGKLAVVSSDALGWICGLEDVKAKQKEAKAFRDEFELLLKKHLQDAEAGVDEGDQPLYTWKQQTQMRFSEAALKEARPEIYAEFKREVTFRKLHVTKLGKEAAAMVAKQLNEEEQHDEATSEAG